MCEYVVSGCCVCVSICVGVSVRSGFCTSNLNPAQHIVCMYVCVQAIDYLVLLVSDS